MIHSGSLLVTLVQLVDRLPLPSPPTRRGRGWPRFYPDQLFLKALVIMIVRHLHRGHELLTVLEQPTPEMQALRASLRVDDRFPTRRTWERRLTDLPATLPAQIGCFGRHLVTLLQPWARCGRAVALDSTALAARGGVWHKQDREAGIVPHTSIDCEAGWTRSGWHGWVYGWKLHLATVVAAVWIPVAARLTTANQADNEVAPALVRELPAEARFVLGDTQYNAPNVQATCDQTGRILVVSRRGPIPTPVWASRWGGSFTNSAPEPSRTSTSSSEGSSTRTGRCRRRGRGTPLASRWGPCSSTS
jgi:hypothetical protein